MTLAMKDGRLAEVEPGAGRVLGLLSIAELPRRLTLDFRDFFSKGFAFNRIGGDVRFASGQARSDNLVIDGPAAEIRIRGAADLRAQRYDHRSAAQDRQPADRGWRDHGRPRRRCGRRGGERGAEAPARRIRRQDLSRDRAVEGSEGRSRQPRAAAGGAPRR